jgi:hypothetical protein
VNQTSGLDRLVVSPSSGLQRLWLPLLFLLLYALGWLGYGVWRLLGPDRDPGEFDDVRDAWSQIRTALDEAGLRLGTVPVFLVLGNPSSGVRAVFDAARLPLRVRAVSGPLAAFAGPEGIFICCPGVSLLPLLTPRLTAVVQPTAAPHELLGTEPPEVAPLPEAKPQAKALLLMESEGSPARPLRTSLTRGPEAEVQAARLRHVCRLLARDRQPLCPVNGLIALVPFEATDDDEAAVEAAGVLRHDLAVAKAALQLDCPRFVLLCDAQKEPGFGHLARQFPEGKGPSRLMGQNFPLTPDVAAADVPGMIEAGMHWVRDSMLPLALARLLRREGEGELTDRSAAVQVNTEVFHYLLAMRDRLRRLARLTALCLPDHPPRLGGCYVAGTGADERDQAFVTGVLRRAIECQDAVRWTPDALADDAAFHRYALAGYVGLGLFLTAAALALLAAQRPG